MVDDKFQSDILTQIHGRRYTSMEWFVTGGTGEICRRLQFKRKTIMETTARQINH